MATPGSIVEQGGNLYRVDQETYTYYDTVVSTQTRTDFTGFDDVAICRPKILYFKVIGLRPNTRHFVYFDRVDVSNYINTSVSNVEEFRSLPRNDPKRNPGDKYIYSTGFPAELGGPTTPILSDASGTIEGIFYLQSNAALNFPTGKRTMSFIDINLLDPSRALSFASTTFTVDGGIEKYATNYYTTSQQVARTGTRNNLTFVAPVIKEAVVNNITNEYITVVNNEYVTVNEITQTVTVDPEVGSGGGTVISDDVDTSVPNDTGQGINNNANDNVIQQQDRDRDSKQTVAEYWGHDKEFGGDGGTGGIMGDDACYDDGKGGSFGDWGLPGDNEGGGGGGDKIICTAMNNAYGFGTFRQAVWMSGAKGLHPAYQIGYHTLFKPLVKYAYSRETKDKPIAKILRWWGEGVARRRTVDIWLQRHGKRHVLGAIERSFWEPICYITGRIVMLTKKTKK